VSSEFFYIQWGLNPSSSPHAMMMMVTKINKKAVLSQGNRAMLQLFFSV